MNVNDSWKRNRRPMTDEQISATWSDEYLASLGIEIKDEES